MTVHSKARHNTHSKPTDHNCQYTT